MKDSAERLEMFMHEEYMDNPNMGSPDISTAIRDLLTDLFHIGEKYEVNIPHRLIDAEEEFAEEKDE
jgi:hypothetical protein